jgi:hypothetical protein
MVNLAIDSNSVYWTREYNICPYEGYLSKIDKSGGTATDLVVGTCNNSYYRGLAVDSTNVYWADKHSNTINKVAKNGGSITVLASGLNEPESVAVDSTSVYWTEAGSGSVKKVAINGGVVTTLAQGLNYPLGIALNSTNVYWAEHNSSGTIKTVDKNGGTVTTLASGLNYPVYIALDSTTLYFTESSFYVTGSGAIKKIILSHDLTPPTGSISINSGASYTNSTSVTLSLSASDSVGVTGYYLSTSSSTPSASASGWTSVTSTTNYSSSVSYTLSSGDGTKTIYVWYKDSAGNISSAYSDSITLDVTAPTDGTLTATAGDAQVSLSWSGFSDATSGIASYKLMYSTNSTPSSCSVGTQICAGTTSSCTTTGLTNGTTYYYRICATDNAGNTSTGTTASATPMSLPTATTNSATSVTSSSATLNATVNPNGSSTTAYFQYGTTTSYGNTTSSQSIGSGTSSTSVTYNLTGLSSNTTYYYRVVATNGAGTTYGSDMSFTTSTSCTSYSISPTSQSFNSSGGTGSVSVTALSGCSWTAKSNANWITITSGSIGNGNGTVSYSVTSNSSTSSRTGTMTIAGNTFTVTQGGSASISLTLRPPTNTTVSKGGVLGPFSVSITNNKSSNETIIVSPWLFTSDNNWLSLGYIPITLSANQTLNADRLYLWIPPFAPTGTYYYLTYIYDSSWNLLDEDYFSFTVISISSFKYSNSSQDWEMSGWPEK